MSLITEALKKAARESGKAPSSPAPAFDQEKGKRALPLGLTNEDLALKKFWPIFLGLTALGTACILTLVLCLGDDNSQPAPSSSRVLAHEEMEPYPVAVHHTPRIDLAIADELLEDRIDAEMIKDSLASVDPQDLDSALERAVADAVRAALFEQGKAGQEHNSVFAPSSQRELPLFDAQASSFAASQDSSLQSYISSLKVMGVKYSDGESRLLLPTGVYSIGSTVDTKHELALVEITPREIVFESRGQRYTKSY